MSKAEHLLAQSSDPVQYGIVPYNLCMSRNNQLCVVFATEQDRKDYDWLFYDLLGMSVCCYGNFDNAFIYR